MVLTQPVVSEFGCQFSKRPYRPKLCFTPFSYNASSKFTPLVNFYSLSFGLRPLAACILLRYGNIIFYFRLFIYARFLRKATRAKTRAECTVLCILDSRRMVKVKVKAIQLQAWTVPGDWGSQISRQSAHEGGKIVSPTHLPPLPPRKYSWYSFLLETESTPGQ